MYTDKLIGKVVFLVFLLSVAVFAAPDEGM